MSGAPPGGMLTRILTGLVGYCWAVAAPAIIAASASAVSSVHDLFIVRSLPPPALSVGFDADLLDELAVLFIVAAQLLGKLRRRRDVGLQPAGVAQLVLHLGL